LNTDPKTFLVIGSNSFSGAHFVRHLLKQGHLVYGLSRSAELHPVFLPYLWLEKELEYFQFRQLDLNHDLDNVIEWIKEVQPEYIVNFAAQGMVAQSWQIPEHWYQTNVVAQVKLHNELRKLSFLKKYVHVTTPEVYGDTNGWVKENFHFAPSTPYAVSRAACDLHLMSFFKAYNFPVVFTRAANVFGPGQQLYRIIPKTMLCARTGSKLQLHGGGHSIRSFIHIKDVAKATLKLALKGKPGEVYHLSTLQTISIRQVVEKICHITGVDLKELIEVTEERLGKDQAYLLDSSKVRSEMGWFDKISLESGLQVTLSWVDKNLKELRDQPDIYQHKP
jgi:dTDP-glucose 4,6-dehydratase